MYFHAMSVATAIVACDRAVASLDDALARLQADAGARLGEWEGPHRRRYDEERSRAVGRVLDARWLILAVRGRLSRPS